MRKNSEFCTTVGPVTMTGGILASLVVKSGGS